MTGQAAVIELASAPVNAVDDNWLDRFGAILDEIESNGGISVVHIRSRMKVFCAGADLKLMRDCFEKPAGVDAMISTVRRMQSLFARIACLPVVTLAEIGGSALGGGFELALSCDLRIASADAKIGLPEARLGLLPGAGGTQRLSRICGQHVARRLILAAEPINGAEAERLGIVHWAPNSGELESHARNIVMGIASLQPSAIAACKRCLSAAAEPGDGGYLAELRETRRLFETKETREKIAAFFLRSR